MYIFEAKYINMQNEEETKRPFYVNENTDAYENEEEIYISVMKDAYKHMKNNPNWILTSLEFIAC